MGKIEVQLMDDFFFFLTTVRQKKQWLGKVEIATLSRGQKPYKEKQHASCFGRLK